MHLRAILLSLLLAVSSVADMLPPKPKGVPMQMRIVKNSVGAGGAVLEIPARLLTQKAMFLDLLPLGGRTSPVNLVIAGVLLSAAAFLFGRWFWRRRKKAENQSARQPASHLVIPLLLLLGAGAIVRDAAAATRSLNAAVGESDMLEGTIYVQISNDADRVTLYLTPERRPIWRPPNK